MKQENQSNLEKETKKTSRGKNGISKGVLILSILIAILVTLIIVGLVYYFVIREPKQEEVKPKPSQQEEKVISTREINEKDEEEAKETKGEDEEDSDDYEGWSTYKNDIYSYLFKYPKAAKISEAKLEDISMSPEEHASGKTFEDLFKELTGKICVSAKLDPGIVHFSAPKNEDGFYVMCGAMTGIGTGYDIVKKTEEIEINGKKYEASVMELKGKNDTLKEHNETVSLNLSDGTRITFSSYSDNPETDTWQDYLKNRPTLIKIIESYESTK